MSVSSHENKELLSQILNNHPLKQSSPATFNRYLSEQVLHIHKDRFRYNNNLTSMNKEIIRIFQNIAPPSTPSSNSKIFGPDGSSWTPGGAAIQKEAQEVVPKIKIFETRLKEQQDHFNSLIKAEIPDEIDFTDKSKNTEPIITGNTLDQTMQQRQQELQKIMSSYQKSGATEAWLKGEGQKPDNIKISPSSIIKKSDQSNVKNKRVSFQVTEKEASKIEMDTASLFTKLKLKEEEGAEPQANEEAKTSSQLPSSNTLLQKIIENQELILAELVKLNKGIVMKPQ